MAETRTAYDEVVGADAIIIGCCGAATSTVATGVTATGVGATSATVAIASSCNPSTKTHSSLTNDFIIQRY